MYFWLTSLLRRHASRNKKAKGSIIKYLTRGVTRWCTRSLFQQLMADHEEGNGESAATKDHEQKQQLVPVFRAEGKVLQEIERIAVRRGVHRASHASECYATVRIRHSRIRERRRRDRDDRFCESRSSWTSSPPGERPRSLDLTSSLRYSTELVSTRRTYRTRVKWRPVVCSAFGQSG